MLNVAALIAEVCIFDGVSIRHTESCPVNTLSTVSSYAVLYSTLWLFALIRTPLSGKVGIDMQSCRRSILFLEF